MTRTRDTLVLVCIAGLTRPLMAVPDHALVAERCFTLSLRSFWAAVAFALDTLDM